MQRAAPKNLSNAASVRSPRFGSFVEAVCELYSVRQVRRKTTMLKVLLPKELAKIEAILKVQRFREVAHTLRG